MVTKSNINGSKIAPGELVNLVQRGIMYTELERSVGDDGCDRESAPYSLTTSSRESKQQREQQQQQREEEEEEEQQQQRGSERGAGSGRSAQQSGASGGAEAMVIDADGPVGAEDVETTEEEVTTLVGHTSEVFICAWSPRELRLASGSGDATARIWTVPEGPCGPGREYPSPVVLHHVSGDKDKSKDVTTLDWNLDGTMLATGSYDGQARIWSPAGVLLQTLSRHKGPIFSLKWNRTGKYLLSGSVDKTAVVWDTATGTVRQEFAFHKEPTLDVDWRDEDSFASCSTDRMIYVCKVDAPSYLRCFQGHRDEVNAIKWDPSGTLLASCSDDHTAKVRAASAASQQHWPLQRNRAALPRARNRTTFAASRDCTASSTSAQRHGRYRDRTASGASAPCLSSVGWPLTGPASVATSDLVLERRQLRAGLG
jgi:transducin (beta)-like 1